MIHSMHPPTRQYCTQLNIHIFQVSISMHKNTGPTCHSPQYISTDKQKPAVLTQKYKKTKQACIPTDTNTQSEMHRNTTGARPACLQRTPTPAKLSSTISFRSRAFCPNHFLWCKLLTLPYLTSSWAMRTPKLPVCVQTHSHKHTYPVSPAYRLTSRFLVQQPTFLPVLCCLFIVFCFIHFPPPLFSHTYSPFSDILLQFI